MKPTSFLLAGQQGSGKTRLSMQFPGRKLVIAFDHGAYSIEGAEKLIPFTPRRDEIKLNPRTVIKNDARLTGSVKEAKCDSLYERFLDYADSKMDEDLQGCDVVILDGGSFLARALMIDQSAMGDKLKREDERTDYKYGGETFTQLMWYLVGHIVVDHGKTFIVNFHTEYKKLNKDAARETQVLRVPGEAKSFLSAAFANAWFMRRKRGQKGLAFEVITADPDTCPWARCSFPLPSIVDWTDKDFFSWIKA